MTHLCEDARTLAIRLEDISAVLKHQVQSGGNLRMCHGSLELASVVSTAPARGRRWLNRERLKQDRSQPSGVGPQLAQGEFETEYLLYLGKSVGNSLGAWYCLVYRFVL